MMRRDYLDAAAREVERRLGIPFSNVLINATHTHHAPTTVSIHDYERDETFCARVRDGIVEAVSRAHERMRAAPLTAMRYRLGAEASVGENSRLLLEDGTVYWVGPRDDALRPTDPFDADLPVLAFPAPAGGGSRYEAILFNHSTHCIGTRAPGARSPSFYGLAAQALEEDDLAATALFLSGAFGSTHNLTLVCPEMERRIRGAVEHALARAVPLAARPVRGVRREVTYRVRRFDEDAEERAVSAYCHKRLGGDPESVVRVFRRMRRELAPHQGEERATWIQALRLGDVAFVSVPGEFFTVLGIDIKRRSPFRHTVVAGVANDYVGYIPDEAGFDLGGYQVWTGFHSLVERGTGERFVATAVELLEEIAGG
jgi:hypothetical protein